ncbi:phosphate/phosphite/phosphonate ABC transporter substrate-binding protein [Thiomicrorhabdus sp. Kp2]|uniref:phosphate/phosphite/phosphonate ABC transporter substrate-binding protein n=1 Tax=Thiomicrorhabdus sp. Kp2 TaxID=1123518 RepID=UPI0004257795|nr:phosphate/phosphite/phosphonate ABC transporter substrate-binding protein [Thiomicrorhabdus sp. Kp2]
MKFIYGIFCFFILSIQGCSQQTDAVQLPETVKAENGLPEYHFAVHPLHNPTRLFEVFHPLIEYLNNNIPEATFEVEASRNYASFDDKLKNRSVPFALPNPYQTLIAMEHGYNVIAKMGDDENFKGIILVRKDSGITKPRDLKGKTVSYPAPTALAATILPQYYLQTHGLDINQDIENKYVGSQESSIMNVFSGTVAAGATWPPPWNALSAENPELKKQLKVVWQTQSLPNNSVVVRDDIPKNIAIKVQKLMADLHKHPEGQEILQRMYLSQFEKADNTTYQTVQNFIKNFEQKVRPL